MTTKTPALIEVLTELINSPEPKKLRNPLSGGLMLAYTPGDKNQAEPGVYRLALSRRGAWPSEDEVRVTQRELREALKKYNRYAGAINWEPWLKGAETRRPSDQIMYHVLFWEEMTQASWL